MLSIYILVSSESFLHFRSSNKITKWASSVIPGAVPTSPCSSFLLWFPASPTLPVESLDSLKSHLGLYLLQKLLNEISPFCVFYDILLVFFLQVFHHVLPWITTICGLASSLLLAFLKQELITFMSKLC